MQDPILLLSPHKAAVPAQGGTLDVLVRLQAPDLPAHSTTRNTPKRLALVVDRSGSMSGQPLDEAMRCVMHIANHLTPQDQLSVVVYDNRVDVLHPLQSMRSVNDVQQALSGVTCGGSTNLFGGWEAGAQQLEGGDASSITRIMLLSDGRVNHGETNPAVIEAHCKRMWGQGVSTTTVGLGRSFNEDLMIGMAREGGGQQYYGQTAADLYDSFEEELSLLQAMYLRRIGLKLVPAPGVIIEMISDAQSDASGSYPMTDLAWGAETWLALRLHVSPAAAGSLRDLLAATITGTDMQGNQLNATAAMLQLPVMGADAIAAMNADVTVDRRLLELEFSKASQNLRRIAKRGDHEETEKALAVMDVRFGAHPWLNAKLVQLRRLAASDMEMMMKEVVFASARMSRRLVAKEEMAFCADETNSQMPSFLRKKVSEGRGRNKP
jgi:Ca-activated chloride channel family protein